MANHGGPPEYISPDGLWRWDGTEWVPNQATGPQPGPVKKAHLWRNLALGVGGFLVFLFVVGLIGSAMTPNTAATHFATKSPSPATSPSLSASPSVAAAPAAAPQPSTAAPATAPKVAPPPAALSVHITESTYGHVAAQTSAGAGCSVVATLPSGNQSTAQGLQGSQTAEADGMVSWTYRTTSKTTKGTGSYTVRCSLNGQTASDSAPFTVA